MNTENHLRELADIIRKLHGAEATHRESVPVNERNNGQAVWEGVVEVFDLKDHNQAETAYAWAHKTGNPQKSTRHVTVLHLGRVISRITAVRAFILQEFKANAAAEA